MPTDQGVGFDDDQSLPPIKPSGESGESESDRIGSSPWFDLSLHVEAELFAQK